MNTQSFIEQVDAKIQKNHLLNHSLYQSWNAGELSKNHSQIRRTIF